MSDALKIGLAGLFAGLVLGAGVTALAFVFSAGEAALVVQPVAGTESPQEGAKTPALPPRDLDSGSQKALEAPLEPAAAEPGERFTEEARAALESEKARLEEEVRELKARLEAEDAPVVRSPAVYRFGLGEETPNFDKADWAAMSNHILEMSKSLPSFVESQLAGRQPAEEDLKKIVEHNTPLAAFAMSVMGEVEGTNANGSFTHPAVLANLVRSALAGSPHPLTAEQELSIRALGEGWNAEWERTKGTFTEATPLLRKLVEEVDAKLRFLYSVKRILMPEQKAILFNPVTEGRRQIDLFSPALSYVFWQPVGSESREDLEEKTLKALLATAKIKDVETDSLNWIGKAWLDELPFALVPVERGSMDFYCPHVDRIQAGARAQLAAVERLASTGRLTPEQVMTLRKVSMVFSPQLLASGTPDNGAEGSGD